MNPPFICPAGQTVQTKSHIIRHVHYYPHSLLFTGLQI